MIKISEVKIVICRMEEKMKLFVKEKLLSMHNRYYIYNENEEFTDAQAEFYNNEIEKSENGFYDDTPNISLAELKERVANFEK